MAREQFVGELLAFQALAYIPPDESVSASLTLSGRLSPKSLLIISAATVLLYHGALGPLAALEWNRIALESGLHDAAEVAYRPLDWVCERSETCSDVQNGWGRLWTNGAPW